MSFSISVPRLHYQRGTLCALEYANMAAIFAKFN
nr:MAG TPA: hypothetical protein [Caudoviricetes sp.]